MAVWQVTSARARVQRCTVHCVCVFVCVSCGCVNVSVYVEWCACVTCVSYWCMLVTQLSCSCLSICTSPVRPSCTLKGEKGFAQAIARDDTVVRLSTLAQCARSQVDKNGDKIAGKKKNRYSHDMRSGVVRGTLVRCAKTKMDWAVVVVLFVASRCLSECVYHSPLGRPTSSEATTAFMATSSCRDDGRASASRASADCPSFCMASKPAGAMSGHCRSLPART